MIKREEGRERDVEGSRRHRVFVVEDYDLAQHRYLDDFDRRGWLVAITDSLAGARVAIEEAKRQRHPFDLVVLDLVLADGHGLDLVDSIRGSGVCHALVVVSAYIDADLALRLYDLGLVFLPKPARADQIITAAERICRRAVPDDLDAFAVHHRLTPREKELLGLAVIRRSNAEAAAEMGLTPGTVKKMWTRICYKVDCHSQRDVLAKLFAFTSWRAPAAQRARAR